jgi:2-oxo-3-hexenedioate decarboxylase
MDISQIADEISSAISSAKQIEPFSKRNINLSTQEAYDVATIVRRNLGSPRVIGRKIGFTNRNIWSVYGVSEPIWGPITKNSISFFESNFLKIDLSQFCEPRIEPEIVVCLKQTPKDGSEKMEIYLDWVAPGFEIVDSIYPNWKFSLTDAIVSGGLHGCLAVGKKFKVNDRTERDLINVGVSLYRGGKLEEEGTGANVLDGPVSAIRYLHSGLSKIKNQDFLSAGDIITTGTMTDAKPIYPNEKWIAKFDGVVEAELNLEFFNKLT